MAKKQAAEIILSLSVAAALAPEGVNTTLTGTLTVLETGHFRIEYKRPRTSKIDAKVIPAARVLQAGHDENGIGYVTFRETIGGGLLDSVLQSSLADNGYGLTSATSEAGYTYYVGALATFDQYDVGGEGGEEAAAAPAKAAKGGKAAEAEEAAEEAPAKPAKGGKGGKGAKAAAEADWG